MSDARHVYLSAGVRVVEASSQSIAPQWGHPVFGLLLYFGVFSVPAVPPADIVLSQFITFGDKGVFTCVQLTVQLLLVQSDKAFSFRLVTKSKVRGEVKLVDNHSVHFILVQER